MLTCRYLQPTEAAVFGETIWQAQLWLAAAAAWCWFVIRTGQEPLHWSLLDLSVWALAAGHALSTIPVFAEGGDRRAAVNITWEWAGLAATLFLVRQVFAEPGFRKPVELFAAVAVGLAALGVWQHHVSLPENAARYRSLRVEEERLFSGRGDATSSGDRQRLSVVRRELAEFGIPPDPGGRKRWEDRLFSTEPFGTFGLANTLAGLLAATVPLIVVHLSRRQAEVAVKVGLATSTAVLLYGLLLTKSRTAWIGLAAGILIASGLFAIRSRLSRQMAVLGAVAACAVVLLGLAGLATGGIDWEVFNEAPKSLRYRLDYWTGALRVLRERPLLGTGAGNFRAYYLQHRPVGASEEIASPHNLFLDVWTAGGLPSLVSLLCLLGYSAYRFVSYLEPPPSEADKRWGMTEWGFGASFLVSILVLLLSGQGIDWRLAAIGPVAGGALFCLGRPNATRLFVVGTGAGFYALTVHLLGADGIEFPAVVQTLLLLALPTDRPRTALLPAIGRIVPAAGFGTLTLGCLWLGTAPVLNAGALVARAEALMTQGDPAADRILADAVAADPWATQPRLLRAELATARANGTLSETDSETALRRWEDVLAAQPRDIHARRRLAEMHLARVNRTGGTADAESAALRLTEAVALSPTDVSLRVDLARAWKTADRPAEASREAREALRLDEVNRSFWHADLVLSDETRATMERLAGVGNIPPGP